MTYTVGSAVPMIDLQYMIMLDSVVWMLTYPFDAHSLFLVGSTVQEKLYRVDVSALKSSFCWFHLSLLFCAIMRLATFSDYSRSNVCPLWNRFVPGALYIPQPWPQMKSERVLKHPGRS